MNPDLFSVLFMTGAYLVVLLVAYFTNSDTQFAWRSLHELRWVILDTFILTYLYGLFRFREGATKQHYDIEAKKDSAQPLLPENSEGKIRNAARTAGNLSEQLPMFVLCMWLYAQVRPVVAAIMGAFYLAFLLLYPILYGDNFNQYVAFSTVPRYIINEYMAVSFVLKAFDLV